MTKDELIRLLTAGELAGVPGDVPVVVASEKGRHVGSAVVAERMMAWGIFLLTEEQRLLEEDSEDIPQAPEDAVRVIVMGPKE